MSLFFRVALVVTGLLSALPASAETVSAAKVNCREEPEASAAVITTVSRGETFSVLEAQGTWSQVTLQTGTACWIATRLIVESALPLGSASSSTTRQTPSSTGRTRRSSAPSSRARPRESGGACPCSGSRVCVGPRGGRYCITSGGRKRYGV